MNPAGASTCTLPAATSASLITPLHAAEVVGVAVRVDHRTDRLLRPVLIVKLERRTRGLGRQQRIDRRSATVIAFDDFVFDSDCSIVNGDAQGRSAS